MKTHDFAFRTAQGGRHENQDFGACEQYGSRLVLIVCDGMGGAKGGRAAAALTTESILDYLESHLEQDIPADQLLYAAIQQANQFVWMESRNNAQYAGMGTTLAIAIVETRRAFVAHVGDSRVYQFRKGQKIFCTKDHSKLRELEEQGKMTQEQARGALAANVITRAVGVLPEVQIDIDIIILQKNDLLLLCTDGIWGTLGEEKILVLLRSSTSPDELSDLIMSDADILGKQSGRSYDNMTLALTKIGTVPQKKPSHLFRIIVVIIVCILSICLITLFMR